MEDRVLFKKGKQKEFLNRVKNKINCKSIRSILQFGFDVSYSSLKSYYAERLLLPKSFFENLCYIAKINSSDPGVKYIRSNWGQIIGGKKGMKTLKKKYPKQIKEWRKKGVQNSPVSKGFNLKVIKKPPLSENLAELIGAYLGDGTLNRYQLKIAGDYRYDLYYHNYLSNLFFELFGVKASVYREKNRNTLILLISSKNICSFLHSNFNLKYGHKIRNKTVIPKQLLKDKNLAVACLRGLIDTDGSISRRGRNGSQFCLQFTSHNKLLLNQVYSIGKKLGIFTFRDKTGAGTNKWENILKYFKIVGSSNLKHIIRFHLRNYKNKAIYLKDVQLYLKKNLYSNMNLPYKLDPWSSG